MEIIWTAIIGFIVGIIAKIVMPGRDPGGLIMTILLGVAGAFLAGLVGRMAGWYVPGTGPGVFASILGAMVLLWLYRMTHARRRVW